MAQSRDQLQAKAEEQLQQWMQHCDLQDPCGRVLLEIGFKTGFFLEAAARAGLTPIGLEIVQDYCDRVHHRRPDLDLRWYDGGPMPVDDATCDYVVSFQVLEHAGSLEHILSESLRILKPGGIMYHVCPNYHSFYEGHYKIIWCPFLSGRTARGYLKMLGRDTQRLDSFTLVTPKKLRRILAQYSDRVEVLSIGRKEFAAAFNAQQIAKVKQPFLRGCLRTFLHLGPLRKLLLWMISSLDVYYPITLIVQKRKL